VGGMVVNAIDATTTLDGFDGRFVAQTRIWKVEGLDDYIIETPQSDGESNYSSTTSSSWDVADGGYINYTGDKAIFALMAAGTDSTLGLTQTGDLDNIQYDAVDYDDGVNPHWYWQIASGYEAATLSSDHREFKGTFTGTDARVWWAVLIVLTPIIEEPTDEKYKLASLSYQERFAGKRFSASINDSGTLKFYKYSDDRPPAIQTGITIDTGKSVVTVIDKSGAWWIYFTEDTSVKYLRNRSGGASGLWDSAMTISEYDGFTLVDVILTGLPKSWLFILWKESDEKLYCSVCECGAGAVPINPATPVKISDTLCKPSASVIRDDSGRYHLFFSTQADAVVNVFCKELARDATGTWE
jgi:hypothetical protein